LADLQVLGVSAGIEPYNVVNVYSVASGQTVKGIVSLNNVKEYPTEEIIQSFPQRLGFHHYLPSLLLPIYET
jgi:hypothetical protein